MCHVQHTQHTSYSPCIQNNNILNNNLGMQAEVGTSSSSSPVVDSETLVRLLLSSALPDPLSAKYNKYKPGRHYAHFGAKFLRGVHGGERKNDWFKRCFTKDFALSSAGVRYICKQFNWPLPPDKVIEGLVEKAATAESPLLKIIKKPDPSPEQRDTEKEEEEVTPTVQTTPAEEPIAEVVKKAMMVTVVQPLQDALRRQQKQISRFLKVLVERDQQIKTLEEENKQLQASLEELQSRRTAPNIELGPIYTAGPEDLSEDLYIQPIVHPVSSPLILSDDSDLDLTTHPEPEEVQENEETSSTQHQETTEHRQREEPETEEEEEQEIEETSSRHSQEEEEEEEDELCNVNTKQRRRYSDENVRPSKRTRTNQENEDEVKCFRL